MLSKYFFLVGSYSRISFKNFSRRAGTLFLFKVFYEFLTDKKKYKCLIKKYSSEVNEPRKRYLEYAIRGKRLL